MSEKLQPYCPECEEHVEAPDALDRRDFIRVLGGSAAALALAPLAPARAVDAPKVAASGKPAEEMVKELFAGLSAEQKTKILLPFEHGANGRGLPTRMKMYNAPIMGKRIGDNYTKPQQELIQRILRSLCADENGWRQISRNGTWDGSKSFEGCGCTLFGDPTDGSKQYAYVFTGHHLTVRCDGDSEPGAAFGGPIYYGHSPNGYDARNVFNYQTKSVLSVYDALSPEQRQMAEVKGSPGEQEPSVQFKRGMQTRPGIPYSFLSKDQRDLVEKVMREVLSPYRTEDVNEVMQIIKTTGGMEKIHLAFYHDGRVGDNQRWHFWRLEGQGFVWNYRVLPHVHTFVNISSKV
jgi:hypothetical protein